MHLYIAGPMRGIPEYNFPAFDKAAARLRALGFEVTNPAEMDRARGFNEVGATGKESEWQYGSPLRRALSADLAFIAGAADGVALLTGWRNSLGARAEVAAAEAVGIKVSSLGWWAGQFGQRYRTRYNVSAATAVAEGMAPARLA